MSAMNKLLFSLGRYTQMVPRRGQKFSFWGVSRPLILLCALIGFAESASALPSYARQTGYACIKCHVGGFGPQLTPYGVKFKIAAYTETDHKGRPFANARVGLQYTVYTKYDGASINYDGTGRNASDNNTLYLFLWLAI